MRIVYLNPSGRLGGAETSLREILGSIRAQEPSWELWLLLGEDGPLAATARELGVTVVVKPFPRRLAQLGDAGRAANIMNVLGAGASTYAYTRGLAQLLREIKPDLIHTNGFKMHLLGAWARPRQARLIWHIHDYVSTRSMMRHLLRPFRAACHTAIVNSRSVAQDVSSVFPGLRTVPVYNAIDLQRFSPAGSRTDLDSKSGLVPASEETTRVGFIGTFARWKGHKVFLDAMARLPKDLPIRGYVIGGPIYQTKGSQYSEQELREESTHLGLAERIGFTGFLEDNAAAIRALDVLVHASTEPEPFGMVIIEGMACGKAVVASQAGGAAELFTDGENALAHRPGDAGELSQKIELLCRNKQLRAELGRCGRAAAELHYDHKRLAGELLQVYRTAVAEAGPKLPAHAAAAVAAGEARET